MSSSAPKHFRIRRGLDLPLAGAPRQEIESGPQIRHVALLGTDFPGLKPSLDVQVGDRVRAGQRLFTDKANPKVAYTAPGNGTVRRIERGQRRVLQAVVIEVEGDVTEVYPTADAAELAKMEPETVAAALLASGAWTGLRTRPFGKVANPDAPAAAIFINAMDTNPLAADPQVVIASAPEEFVTGVAALQRLAGTAPLWLVHAPEAKLPPLPQGVRTATFSGPHPAGLSGTHIHFLYPVHAGRHVWAIGYQDTIAIGRQFLTGRPALERIVAVGGPQVSDPVLLRTRLGANLDELLTGRLKPGDHRIISGSVLSGRHAWGPLAFLSRWDVQVSVLREGREQEFLGWLKPGLESFSILNIYLAKLLRRRELPLSTSTNGSPRAMVPIGTYEKVMPLDILPTPLLRALIVGDTDAAVQLGVLELIEEDLGLCTLVCPGKYEYGPILRNVLTQIEREG